MLAFCHWCLVLPLGIFTPLCIGASVPYHGPVPPLHFACFGLGLSIPTVCWTFQKVAGAYLFAWDESHRGSLKPWACGSF